MFRFIALSVVFILLYLGFSAVSEYDTTMLFTIYDYEIEITSIAFVGVFLFLQLIILLFLKLFYGALSLPYLIRDKFIQNQKQSRMNKLLQICADSLMHKKYLRHDIKPESLDFSLEEAKSLAILINSRHEGSFDGKIQFLRQLLNKKGYSFYAAKSLAELFMAHNHYNESLDYALKAFNENENDCELILLLIRVYSKMSMWQKLAFLVAKLQRTYSKFFDRHKSEISGYYYEAAKDLLGAGDDDKAREYLESALSLKPDHIEALLLFAEISTNSRQKSTLLEVLKSAFALRPSFLLAELYLNTTNDSPEASYNVLAQLASPEQYKEVFLALSAYLHLPARRLELIHE